MRGCPLDNDPFELEAVAGAGFFTARPPDLAARLADRRDEAERAAADFPAAAEDFARAEAGLFAFAEDFFAVAFFISLPL